MPVLNSLSLILLHNALFTNVQLMFPLSLVQLSPFNQFAFALDVNMVESVESYLDNITRG